VIAVRNAALVGGCIVTFFVGVGKTCLLLRYANDSFSPTFITTIGIDFKIKNIVLDSKRIKLQVIFLLTEGSLCNRVDAVDLGYSRPRKIPNHYYIVLPRSSRHPTRV
jgi:hypothetical protein